MTNEIWLHRFRSCFLVLAMITVAPAFSLAADVPSLKELLANIQSYEKSIENLHSETKWEKHKQGRFQFEDVVTHYRDELGRMRAIVSHIAISNESGERVAPEKKSNELLFDGEKTVSLDYYPGRVTATGFKTEKEVPQDDLGYRTAQIFEGMWPPKVGPRTIRNALFYGFGSCLDWMKEVEDGKAKGKVVSLDDEGKLFEFIYEPPDNSVVKRFKVLIDASRGWIVTRILGLGDTDDEVLYKRETEYSQLKNGLWAAKSGVEQSWTKGEKKPSVETHFTVQKVALNDEDFDESVFDIVLLPKTAVSDLRYSVNYRVGQEKVFDDDLAQLAEEAKLAEELGLAQTPIAKTPKTSRLMWLILVNVGVLAVVVFFVFSRRTKKT
ncbi:hypothetical protein [Gimesia aquarii]|uniref:Uncharacterized protein n=1 Tax=Gimesia aquarii TaxID=2527964 RepID=A0A517WU19_9PLAN|nr:hypothetical protein [Gimesia aquarii]QDU08741.1 hypothetical protein V202x_21110 [Gimesia aquarii]